MHFEMKGRENAPLIVLLGMPFCSMEPFRPLAEQLEEDCRVLLVTWDGHEQKEITYTNARDQALQTLTWLRNGGERDIALICGLSGGAKAAMELARMVSEDRTMTLGHVLMDGFAFGHMCWLRRMLRLRVTRSLLKRARKGTQEEAVTRMLGSRLVRLFVKEPTPYRPYLTDFVRVARNVSLKTTRRVVHDSCRCTLHEFPDRLSRRLVFMWSRREPAALARRRVMSHYPLSMEQRMADPGTLGFLARHPAEYAQLLKGLALMGDR